MENIIIIIPAKTIPITKYCEIFGLNLAQINRRLELGIWQKGIHVLQVEGCKERFIDLEEVDKWARKNKITRGVTVHKHKTSETINITFTFKGVRYRKPLSLPVTQSNINYAGRLLGEIKNKIERNTFNYADYFPTSPQLKIFGKIVEGITVKHYLDEYLATAKVRKLSPSTIVGYQKIVNELSDFHKITVNTLTPAMIKNWIKQQRTTTKTIRNKLSVLRSAIDEAVTDGIIQLNPVSQISVDRYKSTTVQQNEEMVLF